MRSVARIVSVAAALAGTALASPYYTVATAYLSTEHNGSRSETLIGESSAFLGYEFPPDGIRTYHETALGSASASAGDLLFTVDAHAMADATGGAMYSAYAAFSAEAGLLDALLLENLVPGLVHVALDLDLSGFTTSDPPAHASGDLTIGEGFANVGPPQDSSMVPQMVEFDTMLPGSSQSR